MSGTLRVLPLGGLGENGKNMTVVEYDGRIVVVDAGLRFPTTDMLGIDLVLPRAQPGLLSRSGYAFIDDSTTPVWNAQHRWIEPRAQTDGLPSVASAQSSPTSWT